MIDSNVEGNGAERMPMTGLGPEFDGLVGTVEGGGGAAGFSRVDLTNLIEKAIVQSLSGTTITSHLCVIDGSPVVGVFDTVPGARRVSARRGSTASIVSTPTGARRAGVRLALVGDASLHRAGCTIPSIQCGPCVRIAFPRMPDGQVTGAP